MGFSQEKLKDLFKKLEKYKYVLIVIAAGLLLFLLPPMFEDNSGEEAPATQNPETVFSAEEMEIKIQEALQETRGVGLTKVVLTLRSDMEQVVSSDVDRSESRDMDAGELTHYETQRSEQTVIVNNAGTASPVVLKRLYPEFQGALIVCEGGGDPEVKLKVSEAVAALTGLSFDRIVVTEMKT